MGVITGKVGRIIVSGDNISGTGEVGMEATITMTQERADFIPVGTAIKERITGMKNCTGTVRAAWVTGGTLFQALMDEDLSFEIEIGLTGAIAVFASGCKVDSVTKRVAPGTEVMTEEMAFTGTSWYY